MPVSDRRRKTFAVVLTLLWNKGGCQRLGTRRREKRKRQETNGRSRILRHMELHDFSFSPDIISSREMGLAAHVVRMVRREMRNGRGGTNHIFIAFYIVRVMLPMIRRSRNCELGRAGGTEANQGIYRQFNQFTQEDKNFVRQECEVGET